MHIFSFPRCVPFCFVYDLIFDIVPIYLIDTFRVFILIVQSRDNGFGHMLRKTSKGSYGYEAF